jgi:LPXTG-motif cell wall-anchored protein
MTKQIIFLFLTAPLFATLPTQVNQNTETPMGLWVAVGILILLLLLAFFTKKQKTDKVIKNSSVVDSNNKQGS